MDHAGVALSTGVWTARRTSNHRLPLRDRKFADSPLERDGFELPVPRAMQARLKAKITGFGCIPSSIIWGCRFRAR